ncbi:MAG: hemolysin family protein [Bacteroidota bacterium]
MELFLAILTLSFSFFFSGMEIAYLSASRLKIELRTAQGNRAAQILSDFTKKNAEVIITILIGNNLALVVFTIMMGRLLAPVLAQYLGLTEEDTYFLYTVAQTLISTLIILVLAEYIPKAIFRRNADYLAFPAAYVLNIFYRFLYFPVQIVNAISKFLLKIMFKVKTEEKIVELSKKDLDQYLLELIATSDVDTTLDLDTEMLTNALAFRETKAREFMIPRTEIIATKDETTVSELLQLFIDSGLSKVLVYNESMDNIRGFVHSRSMFQHPESIREMLQPVLFVPETMPAKELLAELTENQRSVAVVVDEFGGTSGMITMEDLVEEVFGEIEDEHDSEEEEVVEEDEIKFVNQDGSYILGARLEIDDLNEEFELHLPDEEYYTTLGGLITYVAERIPDPQEEITIGSYHFTIIKTAQNRLISVKMEVKKDG